VIHELFGHKIRQETFMRETVVWKSPKGQLCVGVCLVLLVSLVVAGCGGGGGSSNNSGGNGNGNTSSGLAVISGTVQDTTGANVTGATVSIAGTSLSGITGSNGNFQINNVPLNATSFYVASPNVNSWYNSGTYNGVSYTFGGPSDASACMMPLPALQASSKGPTPLPATIVFLVNSGSPPAPPVGTPPAGCPKL